MLGGPHPISWRLIEQRLTSFKQEGILPQTSSGHKLQLFPQPNSLFPTPSDFVLSKHPQSHEPIPYNQLLSLSIYLHTHTHTYTHVYTHPMGSVSAKNPNTLTYPLHRVVVQININIDMNRLISCRTMSVRMLCPIQIDFKQWRNYLSYKP